MPSPVTTITSSSARAQGMDEHTEVARQIAARSRHSLLRWPIQRLAFEEEPRATSRPSPREA